MARELDDHGVRLSLGPDAGRRAWIALSWRALGLSMWVLTVLWAVVLGLMTLLGDDGWRYTTSWWVCLALVPVLALLGGLGSRMFDVWERRALGERHGELRLRPRPDASS